MNWKLYKFSVSGKDKHGLPFIQTHEFAHSSEEEARRETIEVFNGFGLYPKKLELIEVLDWIPSPFMFD
jgi:hypothetical protein